MDRESASPDRNIHDDIEPDHTLLVAAGKTLRGNAQDVSNTPDALDFD